ncbi:MAG: type II toxin-antitoxin system PemK/MazF family toxin [Chitinophagaceae bacterium]|jgi:mRNA interferase MazF|nr:type II toxin-antitoxin system PemK/MazF family toxin [Chitinophagaceae bacterium]
MYKQGDIVSVYFPFTNGAAFKKRPALIISNEKVNKTGDYLIAQITSKICNDGLSIDIENADCTIPLPLKSYIRSHKLFTIHQQRILSKISTAKTSLLQKLESKVLKNISTF